MHRFPNRSVIVRFRLAACLLSLTCLLIPLSAVLLIYSMLTNTQELTILSIHIGLFTGMLVIVQWIISSRTRCSLCLTPVLAHKSCSKHRHARPLFGSYRMRVALAVIFKDSFVCPYCNEPSEMTVRDREKYTRSRHP